MKQFFTSLALVLTSCSIAHAQLPAYLPATGLQVWYPFNGNANNATGTGKNATVNGAVLTSDRFGNPGAAYHLDGDTSNIAIDTTFFNIGWSSYTISCWIDSDTLSNPHNGNHNQALINTIPHRGMEIYYNWGLQGKYGLLAGSNPTSFSWDILFLRPSSQPVVTHAWKHIVLVKDADYSYKLYIDGVLDTVHTTTIAAPTVYSKIVMGNIDPADGPEGFYGKIDDYGIWNTALTGCDVTRLHNANAFIYITAQPTDQIVSAGMTTTFTVTDTGTGNLHQWQVNTGSGFTNLTNTPPYSGVTTATLTITGVTTAMNTYKYRCVVNRAGACTDSSAYGKLTVLPLGVTEATTAAISVFPNPATTEVSVTGMEKADILVYNSVGQLVLSAAAANKISLSDLPGGCYVVKLFNESGELVYYNKVVKE